MSGYTGYPSHHTAEDIERREYDALHDMLTSAPDAEALMHAARRVGRFLNNEPNPVYGDSLVTTLLSAGHDTVVALLDEPPTYGAMMIRRVSTTALNIQDLWRGILGETHHDKGPES